MINLKGKSIVIMLWWTNLLSSNFFFLILQNVFGSLCKIERIHFDGLHENNFVRDLRENEKNKITKQISTFFLRYSIINLFSKVFFFVVNVR